MNEKDQSELVEIIRQNDCFQLREKLSTVKSNEIIAAKYKITNVQNENVSFTSLTLLHVAAYYDSMESFLFLEEKLQSEMNDDAILTTLTSAGYYPLHYALLNGSFEVSQYILHKKPDQAGKIENVEIDPLQLAVIGRDPEILETLFEIRRNCGSKYPNDQINKAFERALAIGNFPCLKILIDKHENVQNNDNQNLVRETIAMKAASSFSPQVVLLVMEHQSDELNKVIEYSYRGVREADCFLKRIFYSAKHNPNEYKPVIYKALKILKDSVIDVGLANVKGAVHWMCYLGDIEIAKYMLKNFHIDVNKLDESYQTGPHLMFADGAKEDNIIEMIQLLLTYNYNISLQMARDGTLLQKTLLEKCVSFVNNNKEFLKVTEFLLNNGADPDMPSFANPKLYKTIRGYVKKKRSKKMIELFDKFPPKPINNT